MIDIREYLLRQPLLFDGATGTEYAALPGRQEKRCEQANLDEPEAVSAIHRAYIGAGSRAVKTNTFSVGTDLARGDKEGAERLIRAACRIALEAAGDEAYVFADMGPAPREGMCAPAENWRTQAEIFLDCGVRCFLLETLPGDEGAAEFAAWLKSACPEAFLLVSLAAGPNGYTRDGFAAEELIARLKGNIHIDALGLNCFSGPYHMAQLISRLPLEGVTFSAMPNAGYPTVLGRRAVYGGQPDYFARQMETVLQAGARIVGGCCGTTPAHIAALAEVLDRYRAAEQTGEKRRPVRAALPAAPNPLWEKLARGEKIIAVEYDPPARDEIGPYMDGVRALQSAGADAVTIADCPVGMPRVDSAMLAGKIRRETGLEPLPHMTCRDRNLNAIKALLLGLSVEEIHNVLIVTGDPLPSATREEVKSVFNCNSRMLARFIRSLEGDALTTPFRIFGALNVNARNFAVQLRLAQEKEQNGVECFLTQPVLSSQALENLKEARGVLKAKILGGVYPPVSYRNALFMQNEIAGIVIDPSLIERYRGLDRDQAEALAEAVSLQATADMAPYTDGWYIMTPFNRVALVTRIIENIRRRGG